MIDMQCTEECECFSSFDRSFFNNDGISHHYIHLHHFHSFGSRFHSIFLQVICISMPPSSTQHWNVAYRTALVLYIEMMIAPIKCALRNCYARQQQQQHTNHSNQIN